jgi:hypothetical protein
VQRRLRDERGLQPGQVAHDRARVVAEVEPQVGRDLVVARPSGAELATQVAQLLEQAAFESGVHVLVRDVRAERAVGDLGTQLVERTEHPAQLVVAEQAGTVQDTSVRLRRQQVVRGEPPVELDADREPGERLSGTTLEPPSPEGRHLSRRRSRRAAIFDGRPQSSTKPLASDWSKVSPSS